MKYKVCDCMFCMGSLMPLHTFSEYDNFEEALNEGKSLQKHESSFKIGIFEEGINEPIKFLGKFPNNDNKMLKNRNIYHRV